MLLNARAIDARRRSSRSHPPGHRRHHRAHDGCKTPYERREALKQIEEQVRQRQAELAHALRISTVGELASGLAHELNQPLSTIANGVEACARYRAVGQGGCQTTPDAAGRRIVRGAARRRASWSICGTSFEKGEPQFERADLRRDCTPRAAFVGARDPAGADHAAARRASASRCRFTQTASRSSRSS